MENNSFQIYLQQGKLPDVSACAVIAGNGAEKIRSGGNFETPVFFSEIKCAAIHLAEFAEDFFQNSDFQNVAYFEPFYMKLPNITKPGNSTF